MGHDRHFSPHRNRRRLCCEWAGPLGWPSSLPSLQTTEKLCRLLLRNSVLGATMFNFQRDFPAQINVAPVCVPAGGHCSPKQSPLASEVALHRSTVLLPSLPAEKAVHPGESWGMTSQHAPARCQRPWLARSVSGLFPGVSSSLMFRMETSMYTCSNSKLLQRCPTALT